MTTIPAWLERMELLTGSENLCKILNARVLVVGLGGVGSFAAEFLARAGIGSMVIVDGDRVDPSNKNRQLVALDSTVGELKASVMGERLLDINPDMKLEMVARFLEPDDMALLIDSGFDWVLDCIDSIQPKLELIQVCQDKGVRFISSMGAGGKTDPGRVRVVRLAEARNCPFAQQIRKTLRRRQRAVDFEVVSSDQETVRDALQHTDGSRYKKSFYGTISYMPAQYGLHLSAYVLGQLLAR